MAFRRTARRGSYRSTGRSTSYRRAPAGGRRRGRASTGRSRRSAGGGQTIRLVIEAAPASGVSRNVMNPVPGVPISRPRKAKH